MALSVGFLRPANIVILNFLNVEVPRLLSTVK